MCTYTQLHVIGEYTIHSERLLVYLVQKLINKSRNTGLETWSTKTTSGSSGICLKWDILYSGTFLLCWVLVRPHLEYCVQFWTFQYKRYMDIQEKVQRKVTKMIIWLEHLIYKGKAKAVQPGQRVAQEDLMAIGGCKEDGTWWQNQRQTVTQETPSEHQETFFLTVMVMKHWNRLSREVLEPASLERLESHPGHGPGQLASGGSACARVLDQIPSRGPFQLQPVCDSTS